MRNRLIEKMLEEDDAKKDDLRAYTGRNKIIKFAGCYHGHADLVLVAAGSGPSTLGIPDGAHDDQRQDEAVIDRAPHLGTVILDHLRRGDRPPSLISSASMFTSPRSLSTKKATPSGNSGLGTAFFMSKLSSNSLRISPYAANTPENESYQSRR